MGVDGHSNLQEFQRNTAFAAFIVFVCFGAFVFLTKSLSAVLVPLVWAAFFALPLTALVAKINVSTSRASSWFWWRLYGNTGPPLVQRPVEFTAAAGTNCIYLRSSPTVHGLLEKLENPCVDLFGTADKWPSCCGARRQVASLCRNRIRITKLSFDGASVEEAAVNRLVANWKYFVERRDIAKPLSSETEICLQVFLDQEMLYPAVVGMPSFHRSQSCDGGQPLSEGEQLSGELELDNTSTVSWCFALLSALTILTVSVYVFVLSISLGIEELVKNINAYTDGLTEFSSQFQHFFESILPEEVAKNMETQLKEFAKTALPSFASSIAANFQTIGFETLMFIVYLLFWICEPLPVNSSVAEVVKSYLLMKTFVCLLFAVMMAGLLAWLRCPIWHLFFVITFLLNYIPEFGSIASALLMVPAVLFDGHQTWEQRRTNTLWLCLLGTLFKVITGNIIEVQLYATRGGQHMRMHPVVLMALMMLCEALLGITGMFLAIPIMAAVKYYMVSTDMPGVFLNPLLVFLEGDEAGPHKNFVDRWRSGGADYGALKEAEKSTSDSHAI